MNRVTSDTPSQILGGLSVSSGGSFNTNSTVIQSVVFRPLVSQPTSDYLNSPLFYNTKSGKPVVQHLQSPVLDDNAEGTLLAKFSTLAEGDGKSIINLDQ